MLDIVLGILDRILGGRIFGKLVIQSGGGMIGSIMRSWGVVLTDQGAAMKTACGLKIKDLGRRRAIFVLGGTTEAA